MFEILPVEVNDAGQMALTPPGHVSRLQLFPPLRSARSRVCRCSQQHLPAADAGTEAGVTNGNASDS